MGWHVLLQTLGLASPPLRSAGQRRSVRQSTTATQRAGRRGFPRNQPEEEFLTKTGYCRIKALDEALINRLAGWLAGCLPGNSRWFALIDQNLGGIGRVSQYETGGGQSYLVRTCRAGRSAPGARAKSNPGLIHRSEEWSEDARGVRENTNLCGRSRQRAATLMHLGQRGKSSWLHGWSPISGPHCPILGSKPTATLADQISTW